MIDDFLTEAFLALKGRWKSEDVLLQDAFCRLWGRKYCCQGQAETLRSTNTGKRAGGKRIAKDPGMHQAAVRMHISGARKILRDKFRDEDE